MYLTFTIAVYNYVNAIRKKQNNIDNSRFIYYFLTQTDVGLCG